MRFFTSLLAAILSAAAVAQAGEALVFVTCFKSGKDGAVEAFRLDVPSGRLTPLRRVANVENSYFMTVSADQKFLYVLHAKEFGSKTHESVAAFAVTGRDGDLRLLNRQSTLGSASCYLHLDATGRTLLVANYMGGSVASLPVRRSGSLGKVVSRMQHVGGSGAPEPQDGPHAHCIVTSPDNRFACAADLGLDQVLVYRLDAAKAKLTPHDKPPGRTTRGSGPRHMVFHPAGKHLYAINELGGTITVFDYEPKTAALVERQTVSTLPKEYQGKNACADLKITPNGRFLYGTNRGHDSIASYRVGPDGQLALLAITPSQGQEPQNLAITPGGDLLLCANLAGNNVVVFRIDPDTGHLSLAGPPTSVPSPSCIRLVF
jgi:6-phosphogluconolactonase